MRILVAAGLLCVALTACGNSRTSNMSCEELWHDNLTMGDPMQPDARPYDLDRVRENNAQAQKLNCGLPPIGRS